MIEITNEMRRAGALAVARASGFEFSGPDILESVNPRAHQFVATADAVLRAALAVRESPNIRCNHEPYLGRCAHCDAPFKDGRAMSLKPAIPSPPDLDSDEEAFS
ncbi:hypothetical protein [uncultured Alsobacter sp.]|uniref:hypothetical protein n=1 Tax=uncultured Alsobacter sp. TaxID=1748258 RepID=UPI0025D71032|nr:hypothetical protein [uncultured Alsobacter sp.]